MYNFDSYNVLLSITTNIPVLLMTAFVLQGHIYRNKKAIILYTGKSKDKLCLMRTTSAGGNHYPKIFILNLYNQKGQTCVIQKIWKKKKNIKYEFLSKYGIC